MLTVEKTSSKKVVEFCKLWLFEKIQLEGSRHAWNLLHPVTSPLKCQELHFSCSSLFLLFLCAFPHGVCCARRQSRPSKQVG